jgi:hypothetical protein
MQPPRDTEALAPLPVLARYEAVRLFVARAGDDRCTPRTPPRNGAASTLHLN